MKERMVPAQQLSDAGEDLVRLAAAKDAEIAALKAERDDARAVIADLYDEIATLTERRDRAIADRNETRDRTYETIRQLREQRDRAMKVVDAAKALGDAMNKCEPCDKEFGALWAALDAEAAAETAPSLPETP